MAPTGDKRWPCAIALKALIIVRYELTFGINNLIIFSQPLFGQNRLPYNNSFFTENLAAFIERFFIA
jgi:hypothetical protein